MPKEDGIIPAPTLKKYFLPSFLLAVSLVALDRTVVATALPDIASTFASTTKYSWVATAYLLTSAMIMPVAGRWTDLAGAKKPLLTAFGVFTLGSLLCGLAPSMDMLILARAFQGMGGGAMLAVGTAAIGLMFEGPKRTKMFALLAAFSGIAAALGPLIGGLLTEYVSWRWIFFINFPLGIAALIGLARNLQEEVVPKDERMDWGGAILCACWTVPLFFAFSLGGSELSWRSYTILGLLATALVSLVLFFWREKTHKDPLFQLTLFLNKCFRQGSLAYFFIGGATTTTVLFLPLYLIQVRGLSAPLAGLALTAEVAGLMVGNILTSRITARRGRYYGVLVVGNLLALAGLWGLRASLSAEGDVWLTVMALVVVGVGFGLSMPVYPSAVQNSVSKERMGTASSALQFFRILGAALGTALMGAVMVGTLHFKFPERLQHHLGALGVECSVTDFEEPSKLKKVFIKPFHDAEKKIDQAFAGDKEALEWVIDLLQLNSHEVEYLKNESPLAREALKARVHKAIENLEESVETAGRQALLEAVRNVYLGALMFMALTFLCTLFLPNLPLQKKES